jgi:hypothetical protein
MHFYSGPPMNLLSGVDNAGYVVIVEGASDTQTLWCHGFPSMGLPGAQN